MGNPSENRSKRGDRSKVAVQIFTLAANGLAASCPRHIGEAVFTGHVYPYPQWSVWQRLGVFLRSRVYATGTQQHERALTKFDVKTIERNDWPEDLKDGDSISQIFEYCRGQTKLIAQIVADIGGLCPNLETMTLCRVHIYPGCSEQEQAKHENADDIVPAIKALAITNPKLIAFDMRTVPINDNVVNAFADAFPQLTSFSATKRGFGENISEAAVDALRLSHPGITITIRDVSGADRQSLRFD